MLFNSVQATAVVQAADVHTRSSRSSRLVATGTTQHDRSSVSTAPAATTATHLHTVAPSHRRLVLVTEV